METPEQILISKDRHIIIHGQFGNLNAILYKLEKFIERDKIQNADEFVTELRQELEYLEKVYPAKDGSVQVSAADPSRFQSSTTLVQPPDQVIPVNIRDELLDMRALVDAAYTSYSHDGSIPCRLKTMFDVVWEKAAAKEGISLLDDIPI